MNNIHLIHKAYLIAKEAHKGQFRYDGKTPFIEHPKTVSSTFKDADKIIVAWLHDVVEDSEITFQDLLDRGIPIKLVLAVKAITKGKDEPYLNYILRVKKNPIAREVKIADLIHNSSTTRGKSQKDKYSLAKFILESGRII